MATADFILRIGYAGTLMAYTPGQERRSAFSKIKDWFWTYRIASANQHTRSGYFLLKGVQAFKEKFPELASQLQIQLWGMIEPGNLEQVKAFGISDIVQISGYFNKAESNAKLAACDLLFLPLETGEDPIYIPSKIFDYIKLEKPVLILGHPSDCTHILQRAGLGILADPYDVAAIADLLAELVRNKAQLPEKHVVDWAYMEENFHFKNLSQKLVNIFEELK
ncbi:MAG TPA: glycosyltransferase [Bacteroidetes bacterium]|nr:glycosyltransferase [Bacteroidota bacterium]